MPDPIPFCDLSRALAPIRAEIDEAVRRVVDSGWYLRGAETAAFEEEWAAYCGQRHCVTCNSGTDALTLAAMALRMERAEIQANTLSLTAIGLQRAGATIVLRDVDADGRLAAVTPAAVPVLLFGRVPTAREAEATLFDAAHAHGWKPPSHAVACWSFYPTKTLGALGDGGAVTTNDAAIAGTMRELSGRDDRFYSGRQITSRLDEVQAAILRVKLKHLDAASAERRAIAQRYRARLPDGIVPVSRSDGDLHHLFVVRTRDRDRLAAHLATAGIATKVHFATPLHHYETGWERATPALPVADRWCADILSLPCYPGLSMAEVDRVCAELAGAA